MSFQNWCEWLKEKTVQLTSEEDVGRIYGNIDPQRVFSGQWTLEYTETDKETITYISGATRARRHITAAIRASTDKEAAEIARDFFPSLLSILKSGKHQGFFADYVIEEKAITADARGLVIGESFYAFIDFVIIENKDESAIN